MVVSMYTKGPQTKHTSLQTPQLGDNLEW